MNGKDLRAYRDKRGWTQKQMAELLNSGLDRKYQPTKVSKWERGDELVPKVVAGFLTNLQLEEAFPSDLPTLDGDYEPDPDFAPPPPGEFGDDTAPAAPPGAAETAAQLLPSGRNLYARVCEELFEMVATGVGLVGAATGNQTLQQDGAIIAADKQRLGHAYGKLAETNATFRKMITGATTSGAWMEVALVTGITGGKLLRNHQTARPVLVPDVEPAPEDNGAVKFSGDDGVVFFPQAG